MSTDDPHPLEQTDPELAQMFMDIVQGNLRARVRGNRVFAAHGGEVAVSQKYGRNDPCPCGSGKKFKRCCGKER